MSQRAIRRGQQRREAAEQRRSALRRRRALLATGAAIGATALFAPSAQAAGFEVNTLSDGLADACDTDCTLRDAITLANASSENDTITFANGLSGSIVLTDGELVITQGAVEVNGPGADAISVSGDANYTGTPDAGDSRIFHVETSADRLSVAGLTLTGGYTTGSGGALYGTSDTSATVTDSVITGNKAGVAGGGAASISASGVGNPQTTYLKLTNTVVTGNVAAGGNGGGIHAGGKYGSLSISGSTISGNSGEDGGGIAAEHAMDVEDSEISGNTATGVAAAGGGIASFGKYAAFDIRGSEISGNAAERGGGLYADHQAVRVETSPGYYEYFKGPGTRHAVTGTTISGNTTTGDGGGVWVGDLYSGDTFAISDSTISSNDAPASAFGGGIVFSETVYGTFDLVNSTVSGNTAGSGAGVSVGLGSQTSPIAPASDAITFDGSTIASNTASVRGGGVYLGVYDSSATPPVKSSPTIQVASTIVADNEANGAPEDLDRAGTSTTGGLELSFSLVEAPGDAPLIASTDGPNITGKDPQLGALADNGGPTETHRPADASPVVDQGSAPPRRGTDQRGERRTRDGAAPNPEGGDGTDIGSVEIPAVGTPLEPTPPPPEPVPPGPAPPTTEDRAPRALIKKNSLRAKSDAKRRVSGVATDDNKVATVEISIVSKRGKFCRDMRRSGKFTKRHSCGRPRVFLAAKGTERWSFKLAAKLAPGYYVVYARATDDKRHVQKVYDTKNRRPFRVR
jgi:CSLREA domain-containing protein